MILPPVSDLLAQDGPRWPAPKRHHVTLAGVALLALAAQAGAATDPTAPPIGWSPTPAASALPAAPPEAAAPCRRP